MPGDFTVDDEFDVFGDVRRVIPNPLDESQGRKDVQIAGDLIWIRLHQLGQVFDRLTIHLAQLIVAPANFSGRRDIAGDEGAISVSE